MDGDRTGARDPGGRRGAGPRTTASRVTETINLEVHLKRPWWRRLLGLHCRVVCFSTAELTRPEAREYVDDLQQRWPTAAVALVGEDWYELREPADGSRGSWSKR